MSEEKQVVEQDTLDINDLNDDQKKMLAHFMQMMQNNEAVPIQQGALQEVREGPRRQSGAVPLERNPQQRRRSNNGVPATTENVRLSGKNEFEGSPEFRAHKSDSEADKILWEGREPTPRRKTQDKVEAQCKNCKRWYLVPRNLTVYDIDSKSYLYQCDDCVRR